MEKNNYIFDCLGTDLLPLSRNLKIKIKAFTKYRTIPMAYQVETEDS